MLKNYLYENLDRILKGKCDDVIYDLNKEDIQALNNLLDLDRFKSVKELRPFRDCIVIILTMDIEKDNIELRKNKMNYMSVVTSLIDDKIYNLGGEV